MKNLITLSVIIVLCFNVFAQVDPLKVETYTLNNGLTVYLNVDKNLPMVHGMVVVKGGSKRDPKDATGIAHYFEHIMFKGTDEIGTVDYDSERLYLDSIAALYDQLAATINEDARLKIQTEINRISIKAAEYAIPNEVDKILSRMGGEAINAGTGYERISYYNSFPANQIEKWLEVYSHRFENPVFRLFQSELETVYEEKNLYADNPMDVLFEQVMKEFFKTSPYGQQTILGSTEHLKNPSLTKMAGYFDKYYVANNMALILAGDFDPDMVKPVIEEKFGKWRKGEEPAELNLAEPPFDGREQVTRRLTPIKIGVLGYRSIPKNHPDEIKLQVCNHLLNNNASTGLLDKLREDNDILYAGTIELFFTEVGGNAIFYVPKIIGQSLNAAEKKILAQIEKLKSGDFSDELFNGIKTEMKKNNERMLEDMRWRTYAIADVFVYDDTWENLLKTSREIDAITKEEVVQVANKYFSENYLAFHSKMGLRKKDKIEKPPFKPVPSSNGEMMSEYAKNIEAMPTVEMKPRFIDFEKDVVSVNIAEGIKGYVTNNPVNEIFSIKLIYGKGDYADPMVNQAASAFEFARPKDVSLEEFRKKLQLLGCDFYAYNDLSSLTINITGLEDNLEKTLKLINQLLQEITVDEHQLKKLVEDFKMEHKFEGKDLMTSNDVLKQYMLYGDESKYIARYGVKEIKKLTPSALTNKLNEVLNYEYEVHYCGLKTADEFRKIFTGTFDTSGDRIKSKGFIELERKKYNQNTIYFVNNKKARQSHINVFIEGAVNDEPGRVQMDGFNDYLDGNMSSIIFQEIREFRSLAYGTYGRYSPSFYLDKPGYFTGWLSTQADKTAEAVEVFTSILKDMPEKPERIDDIRKNLTVSINANQPSFRNKSAIVSNWQKQGYNKDPREIKFDDYQEIEFDDILAFYDSNVKGKPWALTITGDKREIDMAALEKYGKVVELKIDDIITK